MKKLILSAAIVFAMSSFSAFAQDTKTDKKECTKKEQCCKDAKAGDKKECCKDAKAGDKKECSKATADKKACCAKADAEKKATAATTDGDKK